MSAMALLETHPEPTDAEIRSWMMGSLCRCTGYRGISDSIRAAASLLRDKRRRAGGA